MPQPKPKNLHARLKKEKDNALSKLEVSEKEKDILREFGISAEDAANYQEKIARGRNDLIYFGEEILGLELTNIQKGWLTLSTGPDVKVATFHPGNQAGKSFASAVKLAHHGFYKPRLDPNAPVQYLEEAKYPMLAASPNKDQLRVCAEYAYKFILGKFEWQNSETKQWVRNKSLIPYAVVDLIKDKEGRPTLMIFDSGAFCLFRPTAKDAGDSFQGEGFAWILYDEAARSRHLYYELHDAILPRLTKYNGVVDIVSTSKEASPSLQDFNDLIEKGNNQVPGYVSLGGSAYDNKFLPHENIKRLENVSDERIRQQSIYGKVLVSKHQEFEPDLVQQMFGNKMIWQNPLPNHVYLVAVDHAFGQIDNTVIMVFDLEKEPYPMVHYERFVGNSFSPSAQFEKVKQTCYRYNNAYLVYDGTGPQGAVMREAYGTLEMPYPVDFSKEKPALIQNLKDYLSMNRKIEYNEKGERFDVNPVYGAFRMPEVREIKKEMLTYMADDKNLMCDTVAALMITAWWLKKNRPVTKDSEMDFYDLGGSKSDEEMNRPFYENKKPVFLSPSGNSYAHPTH